jgi:hypothetical protein
VTKMIAQTEQFINFEIASEDFVDIGWAGPPPSHDPLHPVFEWDVPASEMIWRVGAHAAFGEGASCGVPYSPDRAPYLMLHLTPESARILRDKLNELLMVIENGKPGALDRFPDGSYKITVPTQVKEDVLRRLASQTE